MLLFVQQVAIDGGIQLPNVIEEPVIYDSILFVTKFFKLVLHLFILIVQSGLLASERLR